jgi:hypothetical protein
MTASGSIRQMKMEKILLEEILGLKRCQGIQKNLILDFRKGE